MWMRSQSVLGDVDVLSPDSTFVSVALTAVFGKRRDEAPARLGCTNPETSSIDESPN